MNGFMMVYKKKDGSYGHTFFGQPIASFDLDSLDPSDLSAGMFMMRYPDYELLVVIDMEHSEYENYRDLKIVECDVDNCILRFRGGSCG